MAFTEIDRPDLYFNTVLYTGNGSTQSITGVGFQPDWVWLKARNHAYSHQLFDVVRGATKLLTSEATDAEQTLSGVTSFDSDGFTVGSDAGSNGSAKTFASWNWLASNTTASNTDGSITSTVSANTTSGFSIVSYTGTGVGTSATIGHSLGVAPSMIIVKSRDSTGRGWIVYHKSLGATKKLELQTANAEATDSGAWNNTAPTSTVFSVGTGGDTNTTDNFIAYCFAEKKGFSKFGSYTSNNSSNGPFIYCGFKPAFLIIKNITTGNTSWELYDNKRTPNNVANLLLRANTSDADVSSDRLDILSNGFKLRQVGDTNYASDVMIYMAFAENPFVTSTGIPTTAR